MKSFKFYQVHIEGISVSIPEFFNDSKFDDLSYSIDYVEKAYTSFIAKSKVFADCIFINDVIFQRPNELYQFQPELMYRHQFLFQSTSTNIYKLVELSVTKRSLVFNRCV